MLLLLACFSGSVATDDLVQLDDPPDEPLDTGDPILEEEEPATLADTVTLEGLMGHLDALAEIGAMNNDTRAWTTEGQLQSSDYVIETLTAAGYSPWQDLHVLEDLDVTEIGLSIDGEDQAYGDDYVDMSGTGAGDLEGDITAIHPEVPPGEDANSSNSGCSSEHFDGFEVGDIALVQRGSCNFSEKVDNALDAGASAVLIFNEGQDDRQEPVQGTLGTTYDIPVLGLSYALGASLVEGEHTAQVLLTTELVEYTLTNTFAELPGNDDVVMLGGHLDSVMAGPGLNDNGSGSALILELAVQLAALDPEDRPTVRFAWWDGEEYGLLGSYAYIEELESYDDLPDAYFNYDMVASPNGAPFVYDGDGSTGSNAPKGSDHLEVLLGEGFDLQDRPFGETPPVSRSDSGGFYQVGVATSGIFTGAEGNKSSAEASSFGGLAGEAYDRCYHRSCDRLDNIDQELFLANAKAAAHALEAWSADPEELDEDGALVRPDRLAVPEADCGSAEAFKPAL